jgi:hypothetical protein
MSPCDQQIWYITLVGTSHLIQYAQTFEHTQLLSLFKLLQIVTRCLGLSLDDALCRDLMLPQFPLSNRVGVHPQGSVIIKLAGFHLLQ